MIRVKCAAVLCALMASTLMPSIATAVPAIPPLFSGPTPLFTIEDGKMFSHAYRLGFVTSARTNALSSDIDYYNDIVIQTAKSVPALAALHLRWRAAVSTPTVNAIDNIGPALGDLYGVNGLLVDAGGTWLSPEPSSRFVFPFPDETGAMVFPGPGENPGDVYGVWTGTRPLGGGDGFPPTAPRIYTLGAPGGLSRLGYLIGSGDSVIFDTLKFQTDEHHLYAISQAIRYNYTDNVVVALISEPPGIAMWVFVLSGMFLLVARSRAGRDPASDVSSRT